MEWLTAVIGLVGALAGSTLTAVFAAWSDSRRARTAQRYELRAALQLYGYALDRVGQEIGQLPPKAGRLAQATQAAIGRTPQLDWSLGQLARHTLARPAMRALDEYNAAANRLLLIAPEDILAPVERLNQLLSEVEDRGEDWSTRWRSARIELAVVSRRAVQISEAAPR